jgi:myo-inositol-1(or 4)-monophosphatase
MSAVTSLQSLADTALIVARGAGDVALGGFQCSGPIRKKGQSDLLTEFDLESERYIRAELLRAYPEIPVQGEEQGSPTEPGSATRRWVVDPIDGTTNYAHGHPFWCLSIALVDAAGVPELGVVVAPVLGRSYVAVRGDGAMRDGVACRVSATSELSEALLATGFPYDKHESADNNLREFNALLVQIRGIRRSGSAALDLCFVADGTYDGYWESKLGPWDIAAGALLVEMAGGVVTDRQGNPVRLTPPDARTARDYSAIAASPGLYPKLFSALNP